MRVFVKDGGQKEFWIDAPTESAPTGTVEGIYAVEEADLCIDQNTGDTKCYKTSGWVDWDN